MPIASRFALLTAASLACLSTAPAQAWDKTGHRITGEIAQLHLSPKAVAGVRDILGSESLAQAATWADLMRSSPEEFWQKEAGAYHFVTLPAGTHYHDHDAPEEGDGVTALAKFSAVVRDPKAKLEDKQRALRLIIHIVGDLAQPLHVGGRQDRGGNDEKVVFFGRNTNLHAVWDSGLIDHEQLSYSEWTNWLLKDVTPQQMREWSSGTPTQWLADSSAKGEALYPSQPNISWNYVFEHRETLQQQLTKGGLRMATYLNQLFETPEDGPAIVPQKGKTPASGSRQKKD